MFANSTSPHQIKRLWSHIPPSRKKQLVLLFILMVIASFAELISIGTVIPFLGALATPDILFEHRLIKPIVLYFSLGKPEELLLPTTVFFIISVALACTVRLLLVWMQASISLGVVNELATCAYYRALTQPYTAHIARNSGEIISTILSKVSGAIGGTLGALLVLISSQLILLTIVVAFIAVDPLMALCSLFGFGFSYTLIALLTKKKLSNASEEISSGSNRVVKILQEGLGGIRDVLLDGTQLIHSEAFRRADADLRKAQASIQFVSVGPRFLLEAVGMVAIAIFAYTLSAQPEGFISIIPIVGALAIGAQRLMPLLHQSFSSWALIRGSNESLKDALDLLDHPITKDIRWSIDWSAINFQRSIHLENVSFNYDGQSLFALKNLTLSIPKGARFGIVGTTGSGKSTFVDVVMGLLPPTSGCLKIDGEIVDDSNSGAWYRHVAHVPQAIYLSDASIAENIAFGVPFEEIDMARVKLVAQQAQLTETIESWSQQYLSKVGERGVRLSGGQRQRIGIARALYKQADFIIFDEATSALDNETERAVMNSIYGLGDDLTIIIVAHRLTTLRGCTQIIEIKQGSISRLGSYEDIVGKVF
jgi:ABC-type multidrug transport system fused ATPase/permease subunit